MARRLSRAADSWVLAGALAAWIFPAVPDLRAGTAGAERLPGKVHVRNTGHSVYAPVQDVLPARGGILPGASPSRPVRPAAGQALAFTLDFEPNGEGIEVDAPAGVAYSPDGEYIVVPATGKAPGTAALSVYRASDLAPVRTFPLTHAPKAGFALMRTQPRAVLVNPDDDTVTVVDYEAGVELAVIPVGDRPGAIAISPDDTMAVVQGSLGPFVDVHDVPWSVIDLVSNTETARFDGPFQMGGMTGISAYGSSTVLDAPVLRPAGDQAATAYLAYPNLFVSVVDVASGDSTLLPIASDILTFGRLASTPDGSRLALGYQTGNLDIRVAVIDTSDWTVEDFLILSAPQQAFAIDLLLRPDGSKVVVNDNVGGLEILDIGMGTVMPADISGFGFTPAWLPVANLGGGTNFLLWVWGAGDLGYEIFDWDGNRAAELVVPELGYFSAVFTQMLAISPADPFQAVLADATAISEDLALLDLDPANPQMLVHSALGDGGIEGDAAAKVLVSADEGTALVFDPQSSNAFFLDMQTHARQWVATPKYATDAALVPDGDKAVFVAGSAPGGLPVPGAAQLSIAHRSGETPVDLPLPANAYAQTLAVDATGDYAYTLLGYIGTDSSELARIHLGTEQLDATRLPVSFLPTFVPNFTGFNSDVLVLSASLNDSRRWFAQSHDGGVLAVASGSQDGSSTRITLVDKAAWTVLVSIELGFVRAQGQIMEFSADDSRLYVGTEAAMSVIAVDGAQSKLVQQRAVDHSLTDFTLSPDGTKLYLGVWPDPDFGEGGVGVHGIRVWSASGTMQPITSYSVPVLTDFGFPPFLWSQLNMPTHFERSEDGSRVYVFSLNDEIHVIDPVTDQIVDSVATGFLTPTSVARLSAAGSGSDRFIMTSFNAANDGIASLTITTAGDAIFSDGFQ